jgi:hypothetical protein
MTHATTLKWEVNGSADSTVLSPGRGTLSNYSSYHIVVYPEINLHRREVGILSPTVLHDWWPHLNSSISI